MGNKVYIVPGLISLALDINSKLVVIGNRIEQV